MKETITVRLSDSQSSDRGSMTAFLLSKADDVTDLLNNFFYTSRGKVLHLKIDPNEITYTGETAGTLIARFQVSYTNGCQDLSYNEDVCMEISFETDTKNHLLRLSSEEVREREPDSF
jgi:hypothetical protein